MALWARAQHLPPEVLQEVRSAYGEHFPIEVRHFLAKWLEERISQYFSNDMEIENPQNEPILNNLFTSLLQELEAKASSLMTNQDMFITRMKLKETADRFREKYSHNPVTLFKIIRHCLVHDMKFVAQATQNSQIMNDLFICNNKLNFVLGDVNAEIDHTIEFLKTRVYENGTEVRNLDQEMESFTIHYHDCTKTNAVLQQISTTLNPQNPQAMEQEKKFRKQKEQLESVLQSKLASIVQMCLQLYEKLRDTIDRLHTLQSRILDDELIRWKRDQQLSGNGASFALHLLDTIQEWCEWLAELIWSTRSQIKEAERLRIRFSVDRPVMRETFMPLNNHITSLLSSLVTSTFIIEKQPPQVMKTNTRFTSTVRLLVGGKLNVHMNPPQVKVSIISEHQANCLLKNESLSKEQASGEILNNTGTMEYHQSTKQLAVSFRNMQLKKIKRAEKKGTESVMDEKFSLLFQSNFSVGGGELVFAVWTLSLPVVVIVHGNQEPHAWATVTWDNAFAEPGRTPFTVPDKVPWSQVADALNMKFHYATGRSLTEDNLRFLAEKAFRHTGNSPTHDYSNTMLSWAQFCKEPLPERNFTFWEWFYAVMKLTREHLKGPWNEGFILGFIRKKQAEEMLMNNAPGTFLMRFSDSELGGITIAWVGDQPDQIFMLLPFTSKDFAIRSLADRLADLQHLVYLYPDISKSQAFTKYYTPYNDNQNTSTNGYVKPLLVTHVPGWSAPGIGNQTPSHSSIVGLGQGGPGGSYPATPQTMFQAHSPDPSATRDTPSVASSYTPGLGQPAVGQPSSDVDYVLMANNDLSSIDDSSITLNLDNFSLDLMTSYNKMQ
ncbi:signal transducer and activator of transcription 5B isoform X3 [Pseudomyrmex gracilis]|uniref:signal transducer and activator of transcription 5B isoform X3 n=1 Tax=Pseudomyrmex gracilis TaxID=219809 RepID=UPI0009953EF6|nr:signal transducer and activator of transcription 5B isoform X3 [Pseudomyrmex gracilis]